MIIFITCNEQKRKLLAKARRGSELTFAELLQLAEYLGYDLNRISGNHHVMTHPSADKMILQPRQGKAKDYQVKQLLDAIDQFNLTVDEE